MGIASTSRPILVRGPFRENRQDVLGLSGPDDTAPTSPRATRQWLDALGFRVNRHGPGHWVVTHQRALPEIHLYSESELARFARDKARHYVTHPHPENTP
ncbi:hypothetical protein [Marinobacter lutaoensis]|jgi:hypothetical protein|uniref:hypothetical protein n=1 Tax=Marinobacter lutaoensis TaxID=135739 RepID=UPI000C0B8040|nr:hypothetical protein [Marinobacter lutaoensis]MBE02894.1 hypothetical protein [Marinobacter sp.]MBI42221.1 hypothetical protein [Oceanospirillales bacterium]NVD36423.1 hypothetical protein [Marinobacter lutaoensis]|tara:strand:+ start:5504 stop:5803 length:300 start_codon:yes stop_codon:yes gene_type:complete